MTPDLRADARRRFAESALAASVDIEVASADASARSYWRVRSPGAPARILMDAPHDRAELDTWLEVGARLRAAGLHAPDVFAVDRADGFVLMEDLGTRTYLPELDGHSADHLYGAAFDALLRMQAQVDTAGLPVFDRGRLVAEMELLPEWFLQRHLGYVPACEEWDVIEAAFTFLAHAALEQPRAFMHRDYHSRNLLVCAESGSGGRESSNPSGAPRLPSPGIVDFQGAVAGPIAYDLASLLRDCYIEWPHERVDGWVEAYRLRLRHAHLVDVDAARFRRWFDLVGLQRHVKVLGLFCRLWYRDGKAQYLGDLPLVWRYVAQVARGYPELAAFVALLERALGERDITQARESAA
ncbi:aminoglycoside phosphotransferase family protein [Dokdonella sp.]|uniref:aminoglycoside phosphotransferase family protein n=1 Tax=Dokdonella sp. TaxID=2291710 RepID=UPI002F3FB969